MSRNEAFTDLEKWSGQDFLMRIPAAGMHIIRELKEVLGGEELLAVTSAEFSSAQAAYDVLNIQQLTMENVWDIFTAMKTSLF